MAPHSSVPLYESNHAAIFSRIGFWALVFATSSIPYLLIRIMYPYKMIHGTTSSGSYYETSNYIFPDLTFIGVAMIIGISPSWLRIYRDRGVAVGRRRLVVGVAAVALLGASLCVVGYCQLHHAVNILPREMQQLRNGQDLNLESDYVAMNGDQLLKWKFFMFWAVVTVCAGTLFSLVASEPIKRKVRRKSNGKTGDLS